MVHIVIYTSVILILFAMCMLEDRELDAEMEYLIHSHRIQNASGHPRIR